ncbi:permease [Gemmatirosa kalamazoonensis]|uniref:Permease n=1 Tax=Gemmatirosa kalamazoonensis TaxID=861299 RepID=W0RFE2_9BACT|nr:ABC transporter permease [Gemmatirosa kalamazoonensis]AHG88103.1 permease [Gemmatirosa kalamazoonensis]
MSLSSSVRPVWRSLRRTPAFTITAVITLALGLGAAVAIFALVNGVLLRPLPYGDPDRLVAVWHDMPGVSMHKGNQTRSTYYTYRTFARSLAAIGVYQSGAVNLSDPRGGSEPQRITTAWLTQSVFPVLMVPPLKGRGFTEAEDLPNGPRVVVISEVLWRTRFGADPAVVGRTLEVNGRTHEIVGVMPQRFRFPTAATQLWLPLQLERNAQYSGGFNYDAVARLKPGVTVAAADRDLAAVLPRIMDISPNLAPGVSTAMLLEQARPRPFVVPLKDDITGGIARTLWIVAAAAGLVLVVACANVTNLILVRAEARQRETAVREALGAGRVRVLAHFFAESVAITTVAGAVGVAAAALALRLLVSLGPAELPRLAEVHVDPATIAFAAVASLIVACLCSIVPALRLGGVPLLRALREGGRGGTASKTQQRVRGGLVAAQIAFALVALASSGLLMRTFQRLNAVRPGFDVDGVATFWMSLPRARYASDTAVVRFYGALLDRVRALPGVRAAGITSRLPLETNGMDQDPFYPEGDASYDKKIPPLQLYTWVDGGYFRTMGISLVAGRTFGSLDSQRSDEAIISQATAYQFFGDSTGRSVIGKRFREIPSTPWRTIVGVVGSTRDTALAAAPSMVVYSPQVLAASSDDNGPQNTMALAVRTTGDASAIVPAVTRAVRELDPSLPLFDVRPMPAVFRASMAQLTFTILVLGAAALVTLAVGAVGLYGVMAYVVSLSTREMGVRLALGASPRAVVAMLTRQGVLLAGAGIGVGLVLFALVARFLRTLLVGVAPGDPLTLAATSLLLVAIAALASWIPARRTARLDPADVLRVE